VNGEIGEEKDNEKRKKKIKALWTFYLFLFTMGICFY
jgi:hypothetical protein